MEASLPEAMRQNDRPPDPIFLPEEELYLRFNSVEEGKVNPVCLICPDQSVNRAKYSEPEWVLLPRWAHWGYGAFRAKEIPQNITSGSGEIHHFRVEHDPKEENYSHSEIRAYKKGVRRRNCSKVVSAEFKTRLSQKIRVIKLPDL
jgi:hypothetical protein